MNAEIEVRVLQTGDVAYAATPEDAVACALQIGREAKAKVGIQGFDPVLIFDVADEIVRTTTLRSLMR